MAPIYGIVPRLLEFAAAGAGMLDAGPGVGLR